MVGYRVSYTSKFNIFLSRVAEGTGPAKPDNLHWQGVKSCGEFSER